MLVSLCCQLGESQPHLEQIEGLNSQVPFIMQCEADLNIFTHMCVHIQVVSNMYFSLGQSFSFAQFSCMVDKADITAGSPEAVAHTTGLCGAEGRYGNACGVPIYPKEARTRKEVSCSLCLWRLLWPQQLWMHWPLSHSCLFFLTVATAALEY